jgi:outer membrane receptor for ferrienterochelin and colicins
LNIHTVTWKSSIWLQELGLITIICLELLLLPGCTSGNAPTEKTIIRLSGGRGQRTANIISENTGLLASSREIIIQGGENDKPYGLNPEVAWNYGINFTQHFTLDYREGLISLDFYRTDFENQIVVDLDQSPQQAVFYNLDGESYSNSFQAQVDYEVVKRLDVRLAYRWYDVKTNFNGELKAKPLVAENRAFANLAYETRKYWKFDYTLNWQGNKRIPFTQSNPEEFQLATTSPDFFTMNFQVTKSWRKLFEVYAGVENLLDYKQENPILASAQPFSPYFESSLVWGPYFRKKFLCGVKVQNKVEYGTLIFHDEYDLN